MTAFSPLAMKRLEGAVHRVVNPSAPRSIAPVAGMYLRAASLYSATDWLICVDVENCLVGVYYRRDGVWEQVFAWACTPGAPETPTKRGLFTVGERNEMSYSLDYADQFYYYIQYSGYYLLHSVTYYPGGGVKDGRLGMQLSHGCVRVATENARWMYENIPSGTTVYLY